MLHYMLGLWVMSHIPTMLYNYIIVKSIINIVVMLTIIMVNDNTIKILIKENHDNNNESDDNYNTNCKFILYLCINYVIFR